MSKEEWAALLAKLDHAMMAMSAAAKISEEIAAAEAAGMKQRGEVCGSSD